jgi:hypothetical protein
MMDLEKLEWISVEERLPEERVHVLVYGVLDPALLPNMGTPYKILMAGQVPRAVFVTKRIRVSGVTDGYGFARFYPYGHLRVTHWFPMPKLNGKEVFETLPE